jgi:hypothetical protein
MGAGLLVGTALSVIIPEGMQTLVMAYTKGQPSVQFIRTSFNLKNLILSSVETLTNRP